MVIKLSDHKYLIRDSHRLKGEKSIKPSPGLMSSLTENPMKKAPDPQKWEATWSAIEMKFKGQ